MMRLRWSGAAAVLIAVAILLSGSSTALAAGAQKIDVYKLPITFELNGESKQAPADQQSFIYQNRTYIPLRFVSEALQLQVEWNGAESLVHIHQRVQPEAAEQVDNEPSPAAEQENVERVSESVTGYERDIQYHIFGKRVSPEDAPSGWIIEQRLYVPLRFLAETAGASVHWNGNTYTAKIMLPTDTEEQTAQPADEGHPELDQPGSDEPSPEPSPEPESGPAVNTGAPADSAKSETSILRAAEAKIERLRGTCEGDLWALALEYLASEPENRNDLLAQGEAKLADCDREFANIMTQLESELTQHGYDTDPVAEYERLYEQEKAAARKLVDKLRGGE